MIWGLHDFKLLVDSTVCSTKLIAGAFCSVCVKVVNPLSSPFYLLSFEAERRMSARLTHTSLERTRK